MVNMPVMEVTLLPQGTRPSVLRFAEITPRMSLLTTAVHFRDPFPVCPHRVCSVDAMFMPEVGSNGATIAAWFKCDANAQPVGSAGTIFEWGLPGAHAAIGQRKFSLLTSLPVTATYSTIAGGYSPADSGVYCKDGQGQNAAFNYIMGMAKFGQYTVVVSRAHLTKDTQSPASVAYQLTRHVLSRFALGPSRDPPFLPRTLLPVSNLSPLILPSSSFAGGHAELQHPRCCSRRHRCHACWLSSQEPSGRIPERLRQRRRLECQVLAAICAGR